MCGILFCSCENFDKTQFDLIKYRGPDNTTCEKIENFWFCHHRLSIINPENENGNQPIKKDGVILICNGEIYNYKQLTNETLDVDCEIIIDLYKQEGLPGLSKLDGDFAFVLYDATKQVIITGNDPVGLKPLFIAYDSLKRVIGIGSEIKVLQDLPEIKKIKRHSIGEVRVLDVQTMKFTNRMRLINYDNIQIIEKTREEHLLDINNILTTSVTKRITHTDRPYALLCSGGLDSSLILAITAKILGINSRNIHVFTMSYDTNNVSLDSMYADMLTASLNIEKRTTVKFTKEEAFDSIEKVIQILETHDPNTIRAAIPMYLLAKHIKENTDYKVILSGEGADELFAGYNYFSIRNPTPEETEKETCRLIKNLHSFDVLRAERCFSANGLELRVPFLDRDFIKYSLSIPGSLRLPVRGLEKKLLRDSFHNLASSMNIPDRLMDRQKERMSDGVGYDWVPSIINYSCKEMSYDPNDTNITTAERAVIEKKYYRQIYDKHFKFDTIIKRKLPPWSEGPKESGSDILGM